MRKDDGERGICDFCLSGGSFIEGPNFNGSNGLLNGMSGKRNEPCYYRDCCPDLNANYCL